MNKRLMFDCDGTFIDLYGVDGWLDDLINHKTRPYEVAKPLINMSQFAKVLHKLQKVGYEIGIVSWCAKNSTPEYDEEIKTVKIEWLRKHLPSVVWDEIHILQYGTPKSSVGMGFLFDDEENNRNEWEDISFSEKDLIKTLYGLLRNAELLR